MLLPRAAGRGGDSDLHAHEEGQGVAMPLGWEWDVNGLIRRWEEQMRDAWEQATVEEKAGMDNLQVCNGGGGYDNRF